MCASCWIGFGLLKAGSGVLDMNAVPRKDPEETEILEDGTRLRIRPLRPEDAGRLWEGFVTLSSSSRYRRFLYPKAELTEAELRELTHPDGCRHFALAVAELDEQGRERRGVAVGRFVRLDESPNLAEPAITVLDEFQGRGVGGILCERLTASARERGITHFRCYVLTENRRAMALLRRRFRGVKRECKGEVTIVEVDLRTERFPPPGPG